MTQLCTRVWGGVWTNRHLQNHMLSYSWDCGLSSHSNRQWDNIDILYVCLPPFYPLEVSHSCFSLFLINGIIQFLSECGGQWFFLRRQPTSNQPTSNWLITNELTNGRIMGPQGCPCPDFWNLWTCYFPRKRGLGVINWLALKQAYCPRSSRWAQCNHVPAC